MERCEQRFLSVDQSIDPEHRKESKTGALLDQVSSNLQLNVHFKCGRRSTALFEEQEKEKCDTYSQELPQKQAFLTPFSNRKESYRRSASIGVCNNETEPSTSANVVRRRSGVPAGVRLNSLPNFHDIAKSSEKNSTSLDNHVKPRASLLLYNAFRNMATKRNQRSSTSTRSSLSLRLALEMKSTKTSLMFVLVYLLCWGPLGALYLIDNFCDNCLSKDKNLADERLIVKAYSFTSSVFLPIVYCWRTKAFWAEVKRLPCIKAFYSNNR